MKKSPLLLLFLVLAASLAAQSGTALVLSKGHVAGKQTYLMDAEFPQEKVDEWIEKGYHIQDVSFGDNHWVVTLSDQTAFEEQIYQLTETPEFPDDFVTAQRDQGFYITSLAFGAGKWMIVCAKGTEYEAQFVQADSSFSPDWVSAQAPSGFYLVDFAVGLDGAYAVMAKDTSTRVQQIYYQKKYPQAELVESLKDKTYRITHLSYQNNHWLAVLTTGTPIFSQEWSVKQSFPKNTIESGWTAGYIITQFQRFHHGREIPREEHPPLAAKNIITPEDRTRCPNLSNPDVIKPLAEQLYAVRDEAERLKEAKKRIPKLECCLRVSHIDYISQLFDQEENIYGLLELCYPHSYERAKYTSLRKLLKSEKYQKKFDKFVAS